MCNTGVINLREQMQIAQYIPTCKYQAMVDALPFVIEYSSEEFCR